LPLVLNGIQRKGGQLPTDLVHPFGPYGNVNGGRKRRRPFEGINFAVQCDRSEVLAESSAEFVAELTDAGDGRQVLVKQSRRQQLVTRPAQARKPSQVRRA